MKRFCLTLVGSQTGQEHMLAIANGIYLVEFPFLDWELVFFLCCLHRKTVTAQGDHAGATVFRNVELLLSRRYLPTPRLAI